MKLAALLGTVLLVIYLLDYGKGFQFFYEIVNSSEEIVNRIYYCQSAQLCASDDNSLQLIRVSVFTTNGTQNRWYVEQVIAAQRRRLFGAIEISSVPLQTRIWKRLSYLNDDRNVAIEEPNLIFSSWQPSCSEDSLEMRMKAVSAYHHWMILQYHGSSSSLSDFQKTIMVESKKRMKACLSVQQRPENLQSKEFSVLLQFLHCFTLFYEQSPLFLEECSSLFHSELLQSAHLFTDRSSFLSNYFRDVIEIHVFYQILYLRHLPDLTELLRSFLKPHYSCTVGILVEGEQTVQCQNPPDYSHGKILNLLFLVHLLTGDLYSWKLHYQNITTLPSTHQKVFLRYQSSSNKSLEDSEQLYLIDLESIEQTLRQFKAFYQVYQISSVDGKVISFGISYDDIFSKFEYIVKKLLKLTQFDTKDSSPSSIDGRMMMMRMNEAFRQFIVLEYQSSYTSLILLNYLMIGAVEPAFIYFENQFHQQVGVIKSSINPGKMEKFQRNFDFDCHYVLQSLFPKNSVEDMSCIFYCERLNRLYNRSPLLRISYQLFLLLHPTNSFSSSSSMTFFLSRPHLFNQYFLLISQITNPVILSSDYSNLNKSVWLEEVILLRLFFQHIVSTFHTYCEELYDASLFSDDNTFMEEKRELYDHYCNRFTEESLTAITRGFFLQAYQGISLLIQFYGKYVGQYSNSSDRNCWNSFLPQTLFPKIYDDVEARLYLELIGLQKKGNKHVTSLKLIESEENDGDGKFIRKQGKRMTVGVLSYSFSRHSVGRLFAKIISYLTTATSNDDQSLLFEIFIFTNRVHSQGAGGFSNDPGYDDITQYLESIIPPDHWIDISALSAYQSSGRSQAVLNQILDIQLDVIIYTDLLMQSSQYLFAYSYRLAKVQILFWGHPYTSSNPLIDYFITSSTFEPTHPSFFSRQSQFSEQLVQFDSLSFLLFPPETKNNPDESRGEPALPSKVISLQRRRQFIEKVLSIAYTIDGRLYSSIAAESGSASSLFDFFTDSFQSHLVLDQISNQREKLEGKMHIYGAIQSLMKMHPLFDEAILRLLHADPYAVVILLRNQKQFTWQFSWQKRLFARATSMGKPRAELLNRIFFVNGMKHSEYSQLICSLDVVLDPFPFGGGVTMCDAVAGPCKDRGITSTKHKGSYSLYGSVPFVTIKPLQGIHAIGAGIAATLNDSSIARAVDDNNLEEERKIFQPVQGAINDAESAIVIQDLFAHYSDRLIARYVEEAVSIANMAHERFDNQTSEEKLEEVSDPHNVVYEMDNALIEWKNFLFRVG